MNFQPDESSRQPRFTAPTSCLCVLCRVPLYRTFARVRVRREICDSPPELILDVPPVAEIGPLQANKKHSFHKWRGKERREALSISGAERSRRARKRARRGFGYAPRRAAQAGLTGGADWSGRLRRETNVRKEDQPKAAPLKL
jgi:hypothetical protein